MFGASRTAGALAVTIAGLLTLPTAAMAVEEGAPSPSLEVTTRSHYEPEIPSEPGKTELDIQATFGWDVKVTVRAHARSCSPKSPPSKKQTSSIPAREYSTYRSCRGHVSSQKPCTATKRRPRRNSAKNRDLQRLEASSARADGSATRPRALPGASTSKKCAAGATKSWPAAGASKPIAARLAANVILQPVRGRTWWCRSQTGGIVES